MVSISLITVRQRSCEKVMFSDQNCLAHLGAPRGSASVMITFHSIIVVLVDLEDPCFLFKSLDACENGGVCLACEGFPLCM